MEEDHVKKNTRFYQNNYINIFSFIYEELSKSNKKKLDDMVKDGTINNKNILKKR